MGSNTIRVNLKGSTEKDRSYDIEIERGLLDSLGTRMSELGVGKRCALITNPTVSALYRERAEASLKSAAFLPIVIEMPDGEEYKNLTEISRVYDVLLKERLERDSAIIALGGGVVGDMAGFVAATYLRGVPYVQVPTTLLAQVDSSVGGKTGVNHPLGKNLIGAFYQPRAVYIDPDLLSTLDEREIRAGLGEVVKYGIIWDPAFFEELEAGGASLTDTSSDLVIKLIERSCAIKAEVVSEDEREGGVRAILNLGHTFGHAIEALTNYSKYKHGEAVAIGMVMAGEFAHKLKICSEDVPSRIETLLKAVGLPTSLEGMGEGLGISPMEFLQAIKLDKKVKAGILRFVLPEAIGSVCIRDVGDSETLDFLSNITGLREA